MLELYNKHYLDKNYTSIGLFREIKKKFNLTRVLYPGSFVHITPSLIFSDVVYVDPIKSAIKFFESDEIKGFIEKNKEYPEKPKFKCYNQDYNVDLPEEDNSFDLLISQYAGFVGQATKRYLKKTGILICNDSHGDASMASIDPDYEFIAVYTRRKDDKFVISNKNLDEYFIPKRNIKVTRELLNKTMKGVAYTKTPSGYIFRKIGLD